MIKNIHIICFIIFSYSAFSQNIKIEKSPKKAAVYSTIIPGAGQAYTKKYWKIPIIYSGLAGSIYLIQTNQKKYNLYKSTAIQRLNGDYSDEFEYSDTELITLKDFYRRNRDLSYLSFVGIYILNIIDASINAHLLNYDISENISINISPNINKTEVNLRFYL